jgi:hypothetical protein
MIDVVLHLAALQSDRALFDEFLQRFESAKTPSCASIRSLSAIISALARLLAPLVRH